MEETTKFEAFIEVCRSEGDESIRPAPNPYALANKCGVSLVKLSKCSTLCAALWTFYFSYFIKVLQLQTFANEKVILYEIMFKYISWKNIILAGNETV